MNLPSQVETLTHEHNGRRYRCNGQGKCWFCQQIVKQEREGREMTPTAVTEPQVDVETEAKPAPYQAVCPGYGHRDRFNSCQTDCPNEEQCQAITDTMDPDDDLSGTHVTLATGDGTVIFDGSGQDFHEAAQTWGESVAEPSAILRQPTLNDDVFKPLTISLVRLNFSGGWDTELRDLAAKFDGQPMSPGTEIEFIVRGYICGAGIKFKERDGAGARTGAVNINLTHLVAVLDQSVPVEPEDEPEATDAD